MPVPVVNPALSRRFLGPGDKLGACDLIRQLSVGDVTESYLGRALGPDGLEELVVVKRALPPYRDDPRFARAFLEEARRAATLQHSNIARTSEAGDDDGETFFAMEYVHGEDLQHVIAAGIEQGVGVPLDAALTVVAGACAALNYAHAKAGADGRPLHVVHRDVAPSNVLVTYDGAVKLVDFGIARARTTRSAASLPYSSPEQCRTAVQLDRRSDLFSLGVILYELTTGRLPFTGDARTVLEQIASRDVPRPTTIVPGYPPALEVIVMRALARDPDQRYRSAIELQSQLEDFAHDHGLRISPLSLARLMSSLFPQRLEEWDHARTQGAFFVEQHVLRTLSESGKLAAAPPPPEPVAKPSLRALSPVLQTAPTAVIAVAPQRRSNDGETSIVAIRAPSKKPLIVLGIAAIAGAAIAIAVVLGSGGDKPVPEVAAAEASGAPPAGIDRMIAPTPEPPVEPTIPAPTIEPTPVVEEPAPVEPAPAARKPAPKKTAKAKPLAKKRAPKKVAKPKPRTEKEPGWNDDSPYLPVRPDK